MAQIYIKLKIMPEDIEVNLENLQVEIKKVIEHFKGTVDSFQTEDVAFGLKAIIAQFMVEDTETDTDVVDDNLRNVEGVGSVQVIDIRRALG